MKAINRNIRIVLAFIGFALVIGSCGSDGPSPTAMPVTPMPAAGEAQATDFELTSIAFEPGESIPTKYSCDGDDISPPLQWRDPPQETKSFALIADDPDAPAGTWVHWVLYDLPAETRTLSEAIAADAELPAGGQQGENSWRRLGYGGPCPPGGTHRYYFKLYALDTVLELEPGANKEALVRAMEGHTLAQTEMMGTYQRP